MVTPPRSLGVSDVALTLAKEAAGPPSPVPSSLQQPTSLLSREKAVAVLGGSPAPLSTSTSEPSVILSDRDKMCLP